MNTIKPIVHFSDKQLITPTNPVTVNLIGAGGTGSKVLTCLVEINKSLQALGHTGLDVRLWDDDRIEDSNIGRQRFAESEIGLYKSVALINRANRWAGTNWHAETNRFQINELNQMPENVKSTIYISCVDNVQTRFAIAEILNNLNTYSYIRDKGKYWMDFGNSRYTGQVILSTIGKIEQPKSEQYETVESLPFITEKYGNLLLESEEKDDTPSCSVAEALEKQDLFINGSLAQLGCKLLWNLFRNGLTRNAGFFLNIEDFRTLPIPLI